MSLQVMLLDIQPFSSTTTYLSVLYGRCYHIFNHYLVILMSKTINKRNFDSCQKTW